MTTSNIRLDMDSVLTLEILTVAVRNGIDRDGMPQEQAEEMAQHILNFFGYNERMIDNVLEPEDRDAFYMLEDTGILTTEREETTLYDGREWRIHYWLFRKERILELVSGDELVQETLESNVSIYEELDSGIWDSRRSDPSPEETIN